MAKYTVFSNIISGSSAAITSITGSLLGSASYASTSSVSVSSSYATTASYALNGGGGNSFPYTGSAIVSGSLIVTGSTTSTRGFTGSLQGTATTASFVTTAQTASFVTNAQSASYITTAQTASYVATASFITLAQTASFVTTAQTASFVTTAQTASYVVTANTASFVTTAQTASYVTTAQTASYVATASFITLAQTASFVTTAQTASYVVTANTASFVTTAQTASYVLNAISASYAATSSYATNLTVSGTLTAQTLVVQTITSSIEYATGSNRFGSLITNTQTFTGSVGITGSAELTGSIRVRGGYTQSGTDSNLFNGSTTFGSPVTVNSTLDAANGFQVSANSARMYNSASIGKSVNPNAVLDVNGSVLITGSLNVTQTITGSLQGTATTASFVTTAQTASYVTTAQTASYVATASFITLAQTASFVTTAQTASYVVTANTASFVTTAQTASYVLQAVSASYATTASYALSGGGGGVSQIVAGTNITISPTNGLGAVTINSTGGGSSFPYTGSAIISGSLTVTGSGSFTGNVGINSPNPGVTFEVSGSTRITGSAAVQSYATATNDRVSLVVEPAEFENTGASNTWNDGIATSVTVKGSSTGGVSAYAGNFYANPYGTSTGFVLGAGVYSSATRTNALDTSTNSSNTLTGVVSIAGHLVGLNPSAITNNAAGFNTLVRSAFGKINSGSGLISNISVGQGVNNSGSMDNAFGIQTSATVGATSGTGSGVITNYYDAYLAGATIRATGTVTNKWGVYQLNSAHANYFAGDTGIGTSTPNSKLTVNGNLSVTGSALITGSLTVTGSGIFTSNVGVGTSSPSTTIGLFGSTSTVFGLSLEPSGWNTAKHRFTVPTSGDTSMWSFNYNGSTVDTSLYSTSAITLSQGLIAFYTTGSGNVPAERMRINGSGNVGIGTTSPSYKLDVSGSFRISGSQGNFIVADTGNDIYLTRNGASYFIANQASSVISYLMGTGVSQSLFLANNGNVGIGTTSPSTILHISKTDGSNELITARIQNNLGYAEFGVQSNYARILANGNLLYAGANGAQYFYYGGNTVMAIATSNVGIGTISPTQNLHVSASSTATIRIQGSSTTGFDLQNDNTGGYVWNRDNTILYFGTNNTERMRITNDGNVGIGTTSPSEVLHVSGNIKIQQASNVDAYLTLNPNSNTLSTSNQWNVVGSNSANNYAFQIREVSTTYLHINNSAGGNGGNIGIGTTSPSARLHVSGTEARFGGVASAFISVYNATGRSGYIQANGSSDLRIASDTDPMTFYVNSSEWVRITPTGNVGIGTTSPNSKLEVNGNINVTGSGIFNQTGGTDNYPLVVKNTLLKANNNYLGIKLQSSDANSLDGNLLLYGGSNKRLEIAAYDNGVGPANVVVPYGNLGIGSTSPNSKLEVAGSVNVTGSLTISGTNNFVVLPELVTAENYADDTAAAAGGVPVGGLYRNGNFVLIRLV